MGNSQTNLRSDMVKDILIICMSNTYLAYNILIIYVLMYIFICDF